MKEPLTTKLLQILNETELITADLIDKLLTPGWGYKGSFTKDQWLEFRKRSYQRRRQTTQRSLAIRELGKIYSAISHLKKSGLIKSETKSLILKLTKKGMVKLKTAKNILFRSQYQTRPSASYIIVVFDISEKEKHKRAWLRDVLRNLGFVMLQKSVWIGKKELPEDLISDMGKLNLLSCVKIFSVHKEGNIELNVNL